MRIIPFCICRFEWGAVVRRSKIADRSRPRTVCAVLIAGSLAMAARPSRTEQLILNLDPQSSSLAGVGYVPDVDRTTVAQDPSGTSLTTTYSGTITVDVDNVMNPTTIALVSANAIAGNSGSWLPEPGGGNEGTPAGGDANPGTAAPANYGFFLDIPGVGQLYGASRNTVMSFTDATNSVTAGNFDPFGINVNVTQGLFDANISSAFFGDDANSDNVANEMGTNCTNMAGSVNRCGTLMGNYSVAGGMATLTLPLDFIIGEGDDVQVTFTGTFVAKASLSAPLTGDYNNNGTVDAADYVLWRNGGPLQNDPTPGVQPEDYGAWRANFGRTAGAGFGAGAVPEPASFFSVLAGLVCLWCDSRRRGR